MTRPHRYTALALLALLPFVARAADEPPTDWIDPDTGHRIVRLSTQPGSRTLYFHDNSYTPQGDKLLIATPGGIALVDVAKIGQGAKAELAIEKGNGVRRIQLDRLGIVLDRRFLVAHVGEDGDIRFAVVVEVTDQLGGSARITQTGTARIAVPHLGRRVHLAVHEGVAGLRTVADVSVAA